MTLQEVEAALTALAGAPGLWVNERLALAGNVAIDVDELDAIYADGAVVTLAPEDIATLRPASADDAGEAGQALAATR